MNILSLLQNQLSPQTIGPISNAVGESPDATKSALGAAFPALLGSLLGKANASPSGITDIFNMLKQGKSAGTLPENIGDVAEGLSGGVPPAAHQTLLTSLLGSKLGSVSEFIANRTGIRTGSAASLLGMAAPLLMGTIGKEVASQGLSAGGLGKLLGSQTQYLKDSLPSGLANTLGIGNLLSGTQRIGTPGAFASAEPVAREAAATGGRVLRWAWVPLLIALAVWFAATRTHGPTDVGGTSETNGNAISTGSYHTPDFSRLNLAPGGLGDTVARTISSGEWGRSIDLAGFTTDSTGALPDAAKDSVREIASVITAAPGVKVRITGHGDTDEAGMNRANAIKSALISAGVPEDRIMTGGQAGPGVPTLNLMR